MNKKSMWEEKKNQNFCPGDIESCHLVATLGTGIMVAKCGAKCELVL